MYRKKLFYKVLFSFTLTLLLTIFSQSELLSEDMVLHVPFALQITNPQLYMQDYLLGYQNPQQTQTIYYPVLAVLLKILPVKISLSILFFLTTFLAFTLIIHLFDMQFQNIFAGSIFLLFITFHLPIAGAAIHTWEYEPLPRLIAVTLLIAAIYCFLKKNKILCLSIVLLSLIIHPLTFLYFTYFVFLFVFLYKFLKLRVKIILLVSVFILLFVVGSLVYSTDSTDTFWTSVIRERNSYAFIDMWSSMHWMYLLALNIPGAIALRYKLVSHVYRKTFLLIFFGALFATFIHLIGLYITPSPLLIQMQLGRVWIFMVWMSFFMFALHISAKIKHIEYRKIILLVLCLLLIVRNIGTSENPSNNTETIQEWVKENVEYSCILLTPFYEKGFRVGTQRAVVGEYKDGALSFYSENFAKEWNLRRQLFNQWEKLPTQMITELRDKYGYDYIIEKNPTKRELSILYSDKYFTVYDIRHEGKCL